MENYLLSEFIHVKAKTLSQREALRVRNKKTKEWTSITWKTFSDKILLTAQAMCHWGISEKSNVGVYMQNMAECFYIDFGAFANRAVTIPMYATSSISQIEYIVNEAEIGLMFVGEQLQYDNTYSVFSKSKTLKQIIIVDKEVVKAGNDNTSVYFDDFINTDNITQTDIDIVDNRRKKVEENDIVHIVYTSGTTGEPKGVLLSHTNYLEAEKIHKIRLNYLPDGFLSLCFLPLTHIFEKAWSILCLYRNCTLAINLDPRDIQTTIKEVRPNAMSCVPRFWEKVYAGVQEKIESSNLIVRRIFLDAIETGRIYNLECKNRERKPSWWINVKFQFYNRTIYRILKKAVGLENGIIFPCAGAALSDKINIFMQSVNIPLVYGYGLTETTATVSCFPKFRFEIGSVGKIMPEVDVKIGENNEILIKGKTVTQGYYKKPIENAKSFTEDGWFRTGDAGVITSTNSIILTDRIKDLYKTSNGKYISPQQIETRLSDNKYIDEIAVIGDQQKYVTALIVPNFNELRIYADEHHISYNDNEDLCTNSSIYEYVFSQIKYIQDDFAPYEQIKKFTLLPHNFTIEGGELTNTLKLKRPFILQKYKEQIQGMYKN